MPSNPPLAVPNELRDFSIPNKCKGVIYFYFRESGNKKRNLFIRGRKKRNLFKRRRLCYPLPSLNRHLSMSKFLVNCKQK